MTVESEIKKVIREGNGVATSFSFSPIQIQDASHLEVTLTDTDGDTVLNEGTGTGNYVVVVSSYPGTGSITYPASGSNYLETDEFLTIKRQIPLLQEVDLENQGGYYPEVLEQALDRCVMQNLQQQEDISRAIKIPVTDSSYPTELPGADDRANKYLSFDADGNPVATASLDPDLVTVSVYGETLVNAANAAAAISILSPSDTFTFDNASANATTETIKDIAFQGRDSGSNSTVYSRIRSRVIDPTDTTEDGEIRMNILIAGTEKPVLIVGSEPTVQVYADTGSASANPDLQLYRDNTNADANFGGVISFQMNNDGADRVDFANIQVQADDVSDTTEDGSLQFYVMKNGTSTNVFEVDSNGVNVGSGGYYLEGVTYPNRAYSASASGTRVDFTSIPTWVNEINITFSNVSTNGTAVYFIRPGTSGSPISSGYTGSVVGISSGTVSQVSFATGFRPVFSTAAADLWTGHIVMTRVDTGNFWVFSSNFSTATTTKNAFATGSLDVGGTLDILRFTTSSGTDTFDSGSITIIYK